MNCALYATWAVAFASALFSASETTHVRRFAQLGQHSFPPQLNYGNGRNDGSLYLPQNIAQPVSYTYFSTNDKNGVTSGGGIAPIGFGTVFGFESDSKWNRVGAPIFSDNIWQQSDASPYRQENTTSTEITRKLVKFPLNTVLPGNSLTFDHEPYPGLIEAVNTFSDLTPSRNPNEGVLVTHNTVSLPVTKEGSTTASRTRITNGGAYRNGATFPYREFTETTHNTQGDKGTVIERTQRVRVHQDLGDDPGIRFQVESSETTYASEEAELEEEDEPRVKIEETYNKYDKKDYVNEYRGTRPDLGNSQKNRNRKNYKFDKKEGDKLETYSTAENKLKKNGVMHDAILTKKRKGEIKECNGGHKLSTHNSTTTTTTTTSTTTIIGKPTKALAKNIDPKKTN